MPVMADWAGGSSVNPTPPKYVPKPTTPGGNTFGYTPKPSSPGGGTFTQPHPVVTYKPAPINYASPPTTYSQAPAVNYSRPAPSYAYPTAPIQGGYPGGIWDGGGGGYGGGGTYGGGGGGGTGFGAPSAPPPPPAPPVGGRKWYESLSAAEKAAQDAKFLRGDSDYTEQIGQYTKALDDFIKRITNRKTQYDEDAKSANDSTNQNKELTLNSMGEDFGARGLINSGMFVTEKERTGTRFSDALKNILQVQTRNKSAADDELGEYRSENTIGRNNAKRAALQRQLNNMSLIDTSAMF